MPLYTIDIGAAANDGTGDPLRTAFNEVNLNFEQVFSAGPVLSNIQIANNTILTTNTNGNLVLNPNGIGNVVANAHVIPDRTLARNLGAPNLRWLNIYSRAIDVAGDIVVNGNLSVTGNIINVANIITDAKTIQLANTAGTANAANGSGITVGANDSIATFLFDSTTNNWNTNIGIAVAGPITGTSIAVSDATIYGNVNAINGNYTGNVVVDTVEVRTIKLNSNAGPNVNVLPNITVVNDTVFENNVDVDGNVFVMGNVNADYYIGDGSQLTNINTNKIFNGNSFANINSTNGNLVINTSGPEWAFDTLGNLTAPGNISASFYFGEGGILGNVYLSGNLESQGANVATLSATSAIIGQTTTKYVETTYTGTFANTIVPDWNNGTVQTFTVTDNFILNAPANLPTGATMTLIIKQDAVGNRSMTPQAGQYIFASGVKTLTTTANAIDMINIFNSGNVYMAALTLDYS